LVQTDILILLDASTSMNDDTTDTPCDGGCGVNSKWAQVTAAIDQVVGDTDDRVKHGQWGEDHPVVRSSLRRIHVRPGQEPDDRLLVHHLSV